MSAKWHQPRPRVQPGCRLQTGKRRRKSAPRRTFLSLLLLYCDGNIETSIATITARLMTAARRKMGSRPTFLEKKTKFYSDTQVIAALIKGVLPAKKSSSNGGKGIGRAIQDEHPTNCVNPKCTSDEALEWNAGVGERD